MIKKIKFYSLIFLLLFFLLELISFTLITIITKKVYPIQKVKEINSENNMFIKDLSNKQKCTYLDTLFPHPYLGYVHWNNPKCKNPTYAKVNKHGFFGPDYPSVKNENTFDILIIGGSVAAQFGPNFVCEKNIPESCLNYLQNILKDYSDFKNRKIRVFNGAAGAYKQPQQLIITHMYGHLFDLVISIEGFNEHYIFLDNKKTFDYPSNNFSYVNNSFLDSNYSERIIYKINNFTKSFLYYFPLAEYSYSYNFFYFSIKKISYKLLFENQKIKNFIWNNEYENDDQNLEIIRNNKYIKYFNYLDSLNNYMNLNDGEAIVFFQPALFYDKKKLSKKESENLNTILKINDRKNVYNQYLTILNTRSTLKKNTKIFSMLDIFKDINEEIYTDTVHVNTKGNAIFAINFKNKLIELRIIRKNKK